MIDYRICGYTSYVLVWWILLFIISPSFAATISKAAILGIALGALVILLMILIAACRPYNPTPFPESSPDKPGTFSLLDNYSITAHNCLGFICFILLKHWSSVQDVLVDRLTWPENIMQPIDITPFKIERNHKVG